VAENKQTAQRVMIGVIAIVMTVGTLGAYFLMILQNQDANNQAQSTQSQQQPKLQVDPTAYKVEGVVDKLETTDLKVGDGDEAKTDDSVKVQYKGTIANTGEKFDSTYDTGEPIDITISAGKVIQGWVDGVPGMKVGGKRRLVIPAEQAYGSQAVSGIPANSALVFEIELVSVNPKE
jgi:FKBP-type peptidyl-prolyl cis-trans isomerase